jgi:hypothetical protein
MTGAMHLPPLKHRVFIFVLLRKVVVVVMVTGGMGGGGWVYSE